jgi:hypothetical protein
MPFLPLIEDWDFRSKPTYAWISLEERLPEKGENDTPCQGRPENALILAV